MLDAGYDVWLLNWRASIDLPPNEWTLADAAVLDHPAAVRTGLERTGATSAKFRQTLRQLCRRRVKQTRGF